MCRGALLGTAVDACVISEVWIVTVRDVDVLTCCEVVCEATADVGTAHASLPPAAAITANTDTVAKKVLGRTDFRTDIMLSSHWGDSTQQEGVLAQR